VNIIEILNYCLKKNKTYVDHPFHDETICVKVDTGKYTPIFAQLFKLKDEDKLTLKCDMWFGLHYRELYPESIRRGYHCPPVQQPYWNTIDLDGSVPDDEIIMMIDHAYDVIISKLPKYIQKTFQ